MTVKHNNVQMETPGSIEMATVADASVRPYRKCCYDDPLQSFFISSAQRAAGVMLPAMKMSAQVLIVLPLSW